MAKKNALLNRLQQAPTPSSSVEPDRPTPPKPSPVAKSGPPSTFSDTTVEGHAADLRASVAANAADTPTPGIPNAPTSENPATAAEVTPPVTDPHEVWSRLLRSPQGIKLTDPRIHSLSPQRFDAVLLETLKSAFLAGWDARKGVEK